MWTEMFCKLLALKIWFYARKKICKEEQFLQKNHFFFITLDVNSIWTCMMHIYIYIYAFSRRFYPKRLTLHSSYSFYIWPALAFPGNRTHDLGVASAMLYHLSYRKAGKNTECICIQYSNIMVLAPDIITVQYFIVRKALNLSKQKYGIKLPDALGGKACLNWTVETFTDSWETRKWPHMQQRAALSEAKWKTCDVAVGFNPQQGDRKRMADIFRPSCSICPPPPPCRGLAWWLIGEKTQTQVPRG